MAVRPLKANRWFDEDARDIIRPRLIDQGAVVPELRRRYMAAGHDDFSIDWERGIAVLRHSAH